MARSDSERLAVLKTERDELEDLLGTGVTRYRIGNREVDRQGLIERLNYLNRTIASLETSVNGRSRNRLQLRRRP